MRLHIKNDKYQVWTSPQPWTAPWVRCACCTAPDNHFCENFDDYNNCNDDDDDDDDDFFHDNDDSYDCAEDRLKDLTW